VKDKRETVRIRRKEPQITMRCGPRRRGKVLPNLMGSSSREISHSRNFQALTSPSDSVTDWGLLGKARPLQKS
jgi:hypothetical protein